MMQDTGCKMQGEGNLEADDKGALRLRSGVSGLEETSRVLKK